MVPLVFEENMKNMDLLKAFPYLKYIQNSSEIYHVHDIPKILYYLDST